MGSEGVALVGALLLVLANGFFVAVEFALVKVRTTQLEALAEEGRPGAVQALVMRRQLDTWLSASQVGITLASLALGWVGEPAFHHLIEPVFLRAVGDDESVRAIARTASFVLAFGIITALHIIVGEQVPKMLAISKAEQTALTLAWPMRIFYVVFFPVIWLLNAGTRGVQSLLGLAPHAGSEAHDAMTEQEFKVILSSSVEAGALEASRAELLERALSMMEKTARQVLVPRSQMKVLDHDSSMDENLATALSAGHTVLPVVRGSLDRVEGLVNVKDMYRLAMSGQLKSLSQVQGPVLFVPENITLERLLAEFKRRNKQVAVVVDEHGGTSGMVTLADLVAELVGKVAELGRTVAQVQTLPGGRLELPGAAQLDDLGHTLELEFDVDQSVVTTIAGYLMAKLGRVPVTGDVWVRGAYRFLVTKTDGPRVMTVRIEPTTAVPVRASPPHPPLV